ncbi:MAG: hypothetical protein NTW16_18220 [Bacteroidetes bacterium]|nr:hypothetical protein [Bacteroidota bacterium]
MTVNPLLPVSLTIAASANPVCAGTSVTFTSAIVNGGSSPAYQWKVNGASVTGATGSSYTFAPATGNAITCVLTSNATCATGTPATSNTVTMTVNPVLPVSLSIAASANPVCAGTSVYFTATPTNGGTNPTYQWKVNSTNVSGATNAVYSFIPANGNTVNCVVTSNATCITGNPAASNIVTMTVNPLLPVSLTISASANSICAGTMVTFTSAIVNGGAAPAYQWKINGTSVTGATGSSYTFAPANGNAITCVLTSNATCATGTPATSNTVTMIVNPLLPVSLSIVASANPVCSGTAVTYTATPVNGGTTPAYQWKVNATNVTGATNAVYTYNPASSDAISCVVTSNATCTTGNPATSNIITMMVNPLQPVSLTIAASANPVCAGTAVTFTATPVNGGTTPIYQWKINGTSVSGATGSAYTFVPVNGNAITCVVTSNATCTSGNPATSNTVTMTVNPLLPVSVSIGASANPVCAGTSVTFNATPTNGGTSPAYQWKVNTVNVSGATNATYTFVPVNGNTITCVLISSETCTTGNSATSNTHTMTVNPLLPVSISIAASANSVCAGSSVTYTASPVNGGTSPLYQWKVNGASVSGATNGSYTLTPTNGNVITCLLTSSETCTTGNTATSNAITMTVYPILPVSLSIAASANPVCAGTSVTYTASQVNGGTNPIYQWKVNGINVSLPSASSYTFVPAHGNTVTCVLTSNATCTSGNPATSNAVTMTVNPILPVSVSIAASANPVCAGTSVTFTASPVNGGSTPTYQWKVNAAAVSGATGSSYSYSPSNNDAITCIMTSNATCITGSPATSNAVTMTVNPLLPVSITIAASANPVCAGSGVFFTAAAVNGGTTPLYQWKVNGTPVSGATNSYYSYVPANGNTITCTVTSSETCTSGNPATSNTITMTVYPLLPVSLTIAASANPVCAGTLVTYTATPVNGGTSPIYQWKVNGTNVSQTSSASYSYVPANGNTITCVITSNATCTTGNPATSNTVTMTVNPILPVSVTIAASANPVCAGTSVTFTASPVNGGTTPAYQWKVNGSAVTGATNVSYTFVPANGNMISCVLTSSATCKTGNPATSNTVTMTVNMLLPVSVTIAASSNPVCAGASVLYTAIPVNGGTNPGYQWKVNATNITGATSGTYQYIPVNNDVITCVLTSNATCTSGNPATSNAVAMVVNPLLPVSVSVAALANPVCAGTSVTYTATPVNGGSNPAYQWKVNGTAVSGATNSYYEFTPVNGNTISCVLTSNETCASGNPATSNTVTMTVNALLPVGVSIAASTNPACTGTLVTFTATPVNGGTTPIYQWKINGINVGQPSSPSYSFIPSNGNTITCDMTSSATCTSGNPATSNTITMTVNPLLPVSVSIAASANPACAGNSVIFTATPVNGGTSPAYQWKVNGTAVSGATNSYYGFVPSNGNTVACVVTSSSSCATGNPATSNTVTMTVNPLLPVSVSIAASAASVCAGTTVIFTATPVNGGTNPGYQWKVNGAAVSGATNSTYAFVPVNGNTISCLLTSTATCTTGNPATSNTITMSVDALLPVSVSITASANPVCAGNTVTYTATVVNGGTTPIYQWKVNGINVSQSSGSTYSFIPADGNTISCVVTSNATCTSGNPATSNTIAMTVNAILPAGVSIAASSNPVCAGTSVTFIATPVNGGTTPAYQWKLNGGNVSGATNPYYAFIPANGNTIACVLVSNATCSSASPVSSNIITMTVNPVMPVSISVSASANPVCAGIIVTYTATPVNGGTSPAYQWKLNSADIIGATNAAYAYSPANTDAISCALISSEACTTGNPAISNTVNMTVNPILPVSASIAASANPVCAGTQWRIKSDLSMETQWDNRGNSTEFILFVYPCQWQYDSMCTHLQCNLCDR